MHGAGGLADLKPGHHDKDGIKVIDAEGEIDVRTAPRLRELLTDLASKDNCQLAVNMDRAGFPGSAGLGALADGAKRAQARGGSLDLACTREPILKTFKITGLTKVLGIHQTAGQAIAARKPGT